MSEITIRDNTANQATFDREYSNLLIFGNSFIKGTYDNISGAEESISVGQLMGRVSADQTIVKCVSTATDGSQYPIGVAVQALEDMAIDEQVENFVLVNGGKINSNSLVFDGDEDLDTVVTSGVSLRDYLISNTKGLELVDGLENTDYDN